MVMHEDQTQPKFDKSKKNKVKKIPQRGLGVEKLEKLRIEEQQKNMLPSFSSSSLQNMKFYEPGTTYSLSQGLSMSNAEDITHFLPIWLVNKTKPIAIEPPSNQNYSSDNYNTHFSSQIDEEMTAGTNLRWPSQNAESMKFEYKGAIRFSKECDSSTSACRVDWKNWKNSEFRMNKKLRGNGAFSERDFLTLGLQYQGGVNDDVKQYGTSSEKTLYSSLPIGDATNQKYTHEQRDEALNDVDTRLKL